MTAPPTLYDFPGSGNSYKPYLLLHLLGRPFRHVKLDILAGDTRTAAFLEKNPNGKIPVLEFADGRCLAESNAILFHLAEGTEYLPADPWDRAKTLQWMFFEQYSHEPAIAVLRFIRHFETPGPANSEYEASLEAKSYAALDVMEQNLAAADFFAAGRYTIADIALYAYTHVAAEAGLDLERYPAVRAWLARVASVPGHVAMDSSMTSAA